MAVALSSPPAPTPGVAPGLIPPPCTSPVALSRPSPTDGCAVFGGVDCVLAMVRVAALVPESSEEVKVLVTLVGVVVANAGVTRPLGV